MYCEFQPIQPAVSGAACGASAAKRSGVEGDDVDLSGPNGELVFAVFFFMTFFIGDCSENKDHNLLFLYPVIF